MARPTRAHKDAAFSSQSSASQAAAGCAAAAGGTALIPVAGPFIAAGIGALGAVLSIRAIRQAKIVRDPPRDDFREPTEPAASRLDLTVIRESPVREPSIALISAVDETARLLEAMMIAVERASGAELARDSEAADARLRDAYSLAEAASESLRQSSATAALVQEALAPYLDMRVPRSLGGALRRALLGVRLRSELPREVVRQLENMGFDREALSARLPRVTDEFPVRRLVADLDDLAEADRAYSNFLAQSASDRQTFQGGEASELGPPLAGA